MIRINLLGAPKPKNKKASASSMQSVDMGEVGSPMLKIIVCLLLAGVLNGAYWLQLDRAEEVDRHQDGTGRTEKPRTG